MLSYQSNSPDKIKNTLINFIKKQCVNGLKLREKLVNDGGQSNSILTESVLSCEEITGSKDAKLAPFDYCVYFIFRLTVAFMKNKNLILNKPNISQLKLYYDIVESIFSLDQIESRATRQENQRKSEENKKEGDTAVTENTTPEEDKDAKDDEKPFGDGPKL